MAKTKINEDLERFKKLFGYNPTKGNELNEVRRHTYSINEYGDYADDDEEGTDTEEGADTEEENTDFDFGDEGNPEDTEGADDFGTEEPTEEPEEETDEFGTADEFSAVDELEDEDSDVEEVDVTDIIKKSDEATEFARQALTVGQENGQFLQSLTDKLSNLESQIMKMDTIASKISKLEQDIKTPEEKLELRSLDSYPFNLKLTDYWSEKAAQNKHYDISGGESNVNGKEVEYKLTPEDIEDFDDVNVKNSFVPESYNRKKRVLKEGNLYSDINKLLDNDEHSKLNPSEVVETLKSLLDNYKAQEYRHKNKIGPISRDEVMKNFKKK